MFDDLGGQLYKTFVVDDRWTLFFQGLGNTLIIAAIAVAIGTGIGSLFAIAKVNVLQTGKNKWLGVIYDIYVTVIRGTPSLVQLLIMYYIIFASAPMEATIYVAALAFGINSGAYVAEIVRGGILAVPKGQFEAGRSLGLTNAQTMRKIVLPQAIKSILPALGNEFIVLFKETSLVGYIAIYDLTRAADMIRSQTYAPLVPLLSVAGMYLIIVIIISFFLKKLEKRLAKSDAR